jgi:hypothetical protein
MLNYGGFVRYTLACIIALGASALLATPASAGTLYNNLTPNNQMAMATRTDANAFEIETADDFTLAKENAVNSASFVGLIVPGGGAFSITGVTVEIYRVFPLDSDPLRIAQVPTRMNSPSDNAFDTRDSGSGLTFSTSILASNFTALNSIQPGGIHAATLHTGGDGALTGQEIQFDVTFTTPFDLPADHYFFVPQVTLSNGAQFYWLSASRPISGAGTTPINPDLQAWTRDANLDPDWLRVGADIVGGNPAPTFNAAFSLEGSAVPEPGTIVLGFVGLALITASRFRRRA